MILRVKRTTYKKLLSLLQPSNPKKIAAIKAVRSETKCGLREAKEGVEKFMYDNNLSNHAVSTEHRIQCGPFIKKIVVDYGQGDIEVSIESMELKALQELQSIGIDECADILSLVSVLKAYEEGREIYTEEEFDEG